MSKGSGNTRNSSASKPSSMGLSVKATSEKVLGKLGFEGKDYPMDYVLGKSLTASDIHDINKAKALITHSSEYDINYKEWNKVWNGDSAYTIKTTTVEVDNLFSNHQKYLNADTVAKYANSGKMEKITAFKISGTNSYIVMDGHHRLAAQLYKGQKNIEVNYIEIPTKSLFKGLRAGKYKTIKK